MKEPSEKRKRTLALQHRARMFSVSVDRCFPTGTLNTPSQTTWDQLVRAADSASNNLVEAEDATSDADFLHKMETSLREMKESRNCLIKIKLASLANAPKVSELGLEGEADELAAIFATIVINRKKNLARDKANGRNVPRGVRGAK